MKNKNNFDCDDCWHEMQECHEWQERGYDAGLDWCNDLTHCFVFVLDKKGRFIIE